MVQSRLACVIGLASRFGHDGIRRAREHYACVQILFAQYPRHFLHQSMIGDDIDVKRVCPLPVREVAIWRAREHGSSIHKYIHSTISRNRLAHRPANRIEFANINCDGTATLPVRNFLDFRNSQLGGFEVLVSHNNMGSSLCGKEGSLAPNAIPTAHNDGNPPAQLFFRRLPTHLGFFQMPILDAK